MSTPVVTIFVRHASGCKHAGDAFSKRCKCGKHLRWTANGKQCFQAAKTRSWEEAEEAKARLVDQLSGKTTPAEVAASETPRTIQACVDLFLKDKSVQGFEPRNLAEYRRELTRLVTFATGVGIFAIKLVTRELLTGYCSGWAAVYPSGATRYRVRARHNSFFRFCQQCGWLDRQPEMPRMKEPESETSPLEPEQFAALLDATSALDAYDAARVRGLFLLQRWTGLAIRDALTLSRAELLFDPARSVYRVVTSRQKTGTDVSVPIPVSVAAELLRIPNTCTSPDYFFWDGKRDEYLFTVSMGQRVKKCFVQAGLDDGQHMKSHRLRDTFAVELLQKGVPLEEVSKLLGHKSIKVTEKHYAKWCKGRQERADNLVIGTWSQPTEERRTYAN